MNDKLHGEDHDPSGAGEIKGAGIGENDSARVIRSETVPAHIVALDAALRESDGVMNLLILEVQNKGQVTLAGRLQSAAYGRRLIEALQQWALVRRQQDSQVPKDNTADLRLIRRLLAEIHANLPEPRT